MAASFQLTLDTTDPIINVLAPNYSSLSTSADIWINANELLSPYQEFYFIDSAGTRHDAIFQHLGYQFFGRVNFSAFAPGIATLYGMVKDEVFNPSPLLQHPINLTNRTMVKLEINDYVRKVSGSDRVRVASAGDAVREILTNKD